MGSFPQSFPQAKDRGTVAVPKPPHEVRGAQARHLTSGANEFAREERSAPSAARCAALGAERRSGVNEVSEASEASGASSFLCLHVGFPLLDL